MASNVDKNIENGFSEEENTDAKKPTKTNKKADAKKAKEDAKKAKADAKKAKSDAEKAKKSKADAEKKKKNEEKLAKKSSDKKKSEKDTKKRKSTAGMKFLGGLLFSKMAKGGATELRAKADKVNRLNVFPVPDGDTGDNMRMTIESGIAAIESMDSDNLAEIMKALSHGMLLGARGNSGVILSQFFAGMAKGLEKSKTADVKTFAHALELGVEQAYASVMTPTEGTILTVAREAVEYAVSRINPHSTIKSLFKDLTKEMYDAVDRTPEVLTVLKDAGVVDSGGAGLFYIIDGFNRVLNGQQIPTDPLAEIDSPAPKSVVDTSFGPDSVMEFGYCTELLLQLQRAKVDIDSFDIEPLREFLSSIGNSIVAFKTDSIVKLHVHTFTPEKVLEYCRQYGEFLTVKIENMSVQHSDSTSEEKKEELPKKKYGLVAVSNGPGIDELFRELGVDVIVSGGQTQNPSTNDFLDAFSKINAEHIFVFPNNGNIIMASTQASELYETAKVHVIPTKSIGTGYVAISSLNLETESYRDIIDGAQEAIKKVNSGYISPSIRDAEMNGVQIKAGDTIGVIDKEIVISLDDRLEATKQLCTKLLSLPEKFMLTIFTGKDAVIEETIQIEKYLMENHPTSEVYFIEGGQEIYPYIFVAE